MKKRENWNLGFWKCVAMSWKIAAWEARKAKQILPRANAVRFWKEATYMVKKIETRIGVGILVCLALFIGGCSVGAGVGADFDLFYPEKKVVTPDGKLINWSDPAESRKQVTRHGVVMERNNENDLPMVGKDN